MKFLVLKGRSTNNVLRVFADEMAEALNRDGHEAAILDLCLPQPTNDIQRLISDASLGAVLTFNVLMGDIGFPLLEKMTARYIGWLVDDPIYHTGRVLGEMHRRHTLCPSRHHITYIRKIGAKGSASLMLAGASITNQPTQNFADRDIPILLAASWMGLPEEIWQTVDDPVIRKFMAETLLLLKNDRHVKVFEALDTVARRYGYKFEPNVEWLAMAQHLHLNLRKQDRLAVVQALNESGLPFTLIGSDWGDHIDFSPNVTVLPSVDAEALEAFVRRAKIVVNLNASNGACERAFNAMAAGACVITDESSTLADLFKGGKEIEFFDRRHPSTIAKTVGDLLASGSRLEAIAARGQKRVREDHTWQSRARAIVDIANGMK